MKMMMDVSRVRGNIGGVMPMKELCSAVVALVLVALTSISALAAGAGEVTNLSGTLSVQRLDGTMRVLGQKSEVIAGDILTTQKDSYAQINFTDGSSVTMRPNTQMKIDAYSFVQDQPQADNAFFRLLKGGMRTVTGLVGKRGDQNAYRIGTSTATIGIRGSMGDTRVDGSTVDHFTHLGTYVLTNELESREVGAGFSVQVRGARDAIRVSAGHFDNEWNKVWPTSLSGALKGPCGK